MSGKDTLGFLTESTILPKRARDIGQVSDGSLAGLHAIIQQQKRRRLPDSDETAGDAPVTARPSASASLSAILARHQRGSGAVLQRKSAAATGSAPATLPVSNRGVAARVAADEAAREDAAGKTARAATALETKARIYSVLSGQASAQEVLAAAAEIDLAPATSTLPPSLRLQIRKAATAAARTLGVDVRHILPPLHGEAAADAASSSGRNGGDSSSSGGARADRQRGAAVAYTYAGSDDTSHGAGEGAAAGSVSAPSAHAGTNNTTGEEDEEGDEGAGGGYAASHGAASASMVDFEYKRLQAAQQRQSQHLGPAYGAGAARESTAAASASERQLPAEVLHARQRTHEVEGEEPAQRAVGTGALAPSPSASSSAADDDIFSFLASSVGSGAAQGGDTAAGARPQDTRGTPGGRSAEAPIQHSAALPAAPPPGASSAFSAGYAAVLARLQQQKQQLGAAARVGGAAAAMPISGAAAAMPIAGAAGAAMPVAGAGSGPHLPSAATGQAELPASSDHSTRASAPLGAPSFHSHVDLLGVDASGTAAVGQAHGSTRASHGGAARTRPLAAGSEGRSDAGALPRPRRQRWDAP